MPARRVQSELAEEPVDGVDVIAGSAVPEASVLDQRHVRPTGFDLGRDTLEQVTDRG